MPVYNTENYVAEAIESVLQQTFTDFEFIIIDDGSTDNSLVIIQLYAEKDSRIQIVMNHENLGITKSLNKGIKLARGRFIARMDADDISFPERLQIQYDYMIANPTCAILGTWANIIDESGNLISTWRMPTSNEFIKWNLIWQNTFIHTSVMIRKSVFTNCEPYHEGYHYAEDYELWERMSLNFRMENLPEIYVEHRIHTESIGSREAEAQFSNKYKISLRAIKRLAPHIKANYTVLNFIDNPSNDFMKLSEAIELIHLLQHIYTQNISDFKMRNKIKQDAYQRMIHIYSKSNAKLSIHNLIKIFILKPRYIKRLLQIAIGRLF
ncbi:MAG: glycosyltransferase [Anaerolineaceae bacterium]|nr:glycosyltransferase [Anaerolineaceae bacterium]